MSHPIRLLRTQASQFLEKGTLTTTHAKALKVRGYVSSLIAKTRTKNLSSRRRLEASLFGSLSVKKALDLPDEIKIKLYHMGFRSGDKAPLSRLVMEMPKTEVSKISKSDPKQKKTK